MKRTVFILLFLSLFAYAQNYTPIFHELRGFEDSTGTTHLFYRDYLYGYGYNTITPYYSSEFFDNSVHHYNTSTNENRLFLRDHYRSILTSEEGNFVYGYDFWNNSLRRYLVHFQYYGACLPGSNILRVFDGDSSLTFIRHHAERTPFLISKQNDSLVYHTVLYSTLLKSTNTGITWDTLSNNLAYSALGISPVNHNHLFGAEWQGKIVKSITGGTEPFTVYQGTGIGIEQQLKISSDGANVYATAKAIEQDIIFNNSNYRLLASNNSGNPFTWTERAASRTPIYIALDDSDPNAVHYATGRKIFSSLNGGINFSLVTTLDETITGIHKKKGINEFYVLTSTRIIKLDGNLQTVLKTNSNLAFYRNFYPLKIGYKWIYKATGGSTDFPPTYYEYYITKTIVGDTLLSGKKYFTLKEKKQGYENTYFERIDTLTGYVYSQTPGMPEDQIIEKLYSVPGDSAHFNPLSYFALAIYTNPVVKNIRFGISSYERQSTCESLNIHKYKLAWGIGVDEINLIYDFGGTNIVLQGMIKDGVIYGDTTLVSILNEQPVTPDNFVLEQNYPNPFNPSTTIRWQSPVGSWQTLKVFDVLGNEVATLVDEYRAAGKYETNFNAYNAKGNPSGLASGIYYYQLKVGSFVQTKKLLLLK